VVIIVDDKATVVAVQGEGVAEALPKAVEPEAKGGSAEADEAKLSDEDETKLCRTRIATQTRNDVIGR
jgi:hypothetical protein